MGLDRLAADRELGPEVPPKLARLVELIAADPRAPTKITEPGAVIDAHIADSLSLLDLPRARSLRAIVDMGSGAGFPGLVLALAIPRARVDLVEASGRKCEFIARAIGALEIDNARAVQARVEEWAGGRGSAAYDCATARALGSLPTVLEYAAPLLRVGGLLVVWKGRRNRAEEARAAEAARVLGMNAADLRSVKPFAASRNRHLHVYEKVRVSPPGYPRRVGLAAKRPLGRPRALE